MVLRAVVPMSRKSRDMRHPRLGGCQHKRDRRAKGIGRHRIAAKYPVKPGFYLPGTFISSYSYTFYMVDGAKMAAEFCVSDRYELVDVFRRRRCRCFHRYSNSKLSVC